MDNQVITIQSDNDVVKVITDPGKYLWVKLDKTMPETLLYLKDGILEYKIPVGNERLAYDPTAFSDYCRCISARFATAEELVVRRNLAMNPLDQRCHTACYPHCTANAETRGESVFAARNTVDGVKENTFHGEWPYQSWGEDENPNAEIQVEFGRKVVVDELVIYLRADFPHDNWWKQVTLTFSDGYSQAVDLCKTGDAQSILLKKRVVEWIRMGKLMSSEETSLFPALSQWEIYGTEYIPNKQTASPPAPK